MPPHDIYTEGAVSEGAAFMNVFPKRVNSHAARTDKSQGSGVGDGGGKLAGGNVGHAALYEGALGPQKLV